MCLADYEACFRRGPRPRRRHVSPVRKRVAVLRAIGSGQGEVGTRGQEAIGRTALADADDASSPCSGSETHFGLVRTQETVKLVGGQDERAA